MLIFIDALQADLPVNVSVITVGILTVVDTLKASVITVRILHR